MTSWGARPNAGGGFQNLVSRAVTNVNSRLARPGA
jgi:hypothetical protein